jgi:hypothetical protein
MHQRNFHFGFPWITLYIALLIPISTYTYSALSASMRGGLVLWLTSPFNIFYESMNSTEFFYNFIFVVAIFLFVELYTRNLADFKGRDSLIRNAFLLSVLASYVVSAAVWIVLGVPSSGTSMLAFNMLLFSAFETYDSELIKKMSKENEDIHRTLETASIVFVVLVTASSLLLFIYLNRNAFWYVHIAGGAVFVLTYYIYLSRRVRPKVDALEEKLEKDVETDLEVTVDVLFKDVDAEVVVEVDDADVVVEADVVVDVVVVETAMSILFV